MACGSRDVRAAAARGRMRALRPQWLLETTRSKSAGELFDRARKKRQQPAVARRAPGSRRGPIPPRHPAIRSLTRDGSYKSVKTVASGNNSQAPQKLFAARIPLSQS
jgi:hypothetical protein